MGDLKKVTVRLPAYQSDRTAWRHGIFTESKRAAKAAHVTYGKTEKLDVVVSLYLSKTAVGEHDVDNRLKDVFDGLQGALAGEGKPKRFRKGRIIDRDKYIYRALVEKFETPKYALAGGGTVTIRRWKPRAKPR